MVADGGCVCRNFRPGGRPEPPPPRGRASVRPADKHAGQLAAGRSGWVVARPHGCLLLACFPPVVAPRSGFARFESFELQMGLFSAQRMPALVKVSAPVAATGWQRSQPRPARAPSTPRACEHVPARCWVLDAGGQGLWAPVGCILRCGNGTCRPARRRATDGVHMLHTYVVVVVAQF